MWPTVPLKFILILIFLLVFSKGFAQSISNIETFSVSQSDLDSAPCKKKFPLNDSDIQQWIKSKIKNSVTVPSRFYGEFHFENESSFLLDLFQTLQARPFTLSDISSLKPVDNSCTKVLCALSKIYGSKESLRILYILGEFGYNASPNHYLKPRPFTLNELNVLTMSFSDVPVFLRKKNNNHPLIIVDSAGPYANENIQFFDPWTKLPGWHQNYVLYHEVSHNLAEFWNKLDRSEYWIQLSGWEKSENQIDQDIFNPKTWKRTSEKCLSTYACHNAAEYFAEAFVSYRYSPQRLLKANPAIFNFLRQYYQQLSYQNEESCTKVHPEYLAELPVYQQLKAQMKRSLSDFAKENPAIEKDINDICLKQVLKVVPLVFSNAKKIEMLSEKCMNTEILKRSKIEHKDYTSEELILGLKPLDLLKSFL